MADWAAGEGDARLSVPAFLVSVSGNEDFQVATHLGASHRAVPLTTPEHLAVVLIERNHFSASPWITVGRAPVCDIVLPFATASKVHASLKEVGGRWWVMDVGSTNGTAVDDEVLAREVWHPLADGQIVTFGSLVTEFLLPAGFERRLRSTNNRPR